MLGLSNGVKAMFLICRGFFGGARKRRCQDWKLKSESDRIMEKPVEDG